MDLYIISYVGIYIGKIKTEATDIKKEAIRLVENQTNLPTDILYGQKIEARKVKFEVSKIL